jgi:phospholipase C
VRRALAGLCVTAAVAAACTGTGRSTTPTPTPGPSTSSPIPTVEPSPPAVVDALRYDTRWPIKHVIYLIKENRTYDHLFGRFPGGDGVRFGWDLDVRRPLTRPPDRLPADIPHCYLCAIQAWREGQMDGFGVVTDEFEAAPDLAYTQVRPDQIPNYWHWAKRNVLFDRIFASAHGPSFPNHLYTIAAQSGGARDNPRRAGLDSNTFGCDAPAEQLVEVYDAEGDVVKIPPCFDFRTEGDLLNEEGIPWAYYAATEEQRGYIWNAYSAIRRYREHPSRWSRFIRPVDRVLDDIRAGTLPPVTWITPRFELSEHPEFSLCHGENWTTQVVDAVMRSPMWETTAIFITWDDYGGFYDHVPPPQVDRMGFGIRVPMLLISPYAKHGSVSSELGELSSVLRFIEDNWRLRPYLTHRDRAATPLLSAFDFEQPPRAPDPLPQRTDCEGPRFP